MSQDVEDPNNGDTTGEPDGDGQDPIESTEVEVNKTVSKARQEAHPGDVRRVLSGNPKKKQPTQVKFAQWGDDTEWYDTNEGEDDLDELLGDYDWDPNDGQDFH